MPRSHQYHLGNAFDTVASHSYQCSVIAYVLSQMEGLSHKDGLKCVSMALFHDLVEARTGEIGFIAKHYVKIDENKALTKQVEGIKFGQNIKSLFDEYERQETRIAKIVKDADSLTQIYTEWVMMWQGHKLAQKWFESDFNDRVPAMNTASAKKIVYLMKESNPNEWWWSELMENDAAIDKDRLLGMKK
ncbi:MAG: HD domain-containing protein [Candidatus Pacebacteria bacterium]|nr:HD domain-containing protein [Candidatus Paceibacterota bacterium]